MFRKAKAAGDLVSTWREIGPVAWSEGAYGWIGDDAQPVTLEPWQRSILSAWWIHHTDIRTLAISNVKKTGKTWLNAVLTCWRWLALPGVHFCVGNDMDQAQARQFAMITEMVKRHPYLRTVCQLNKNQLTYLPTGSTLTALAVDAAGNAGANHLTASHTEAWGIMLESSIRAFEELTPPPGEKFGFPALRIIDSYAGFEGDSKTWHDLVDRGAAGEPIDDVWPIYKNGGLLLFHMTGEEARERCFRGSAEEAAAYYEDQKITLRVNAFLRMHGNERTTGESAFIPDDAWTNCYSPDVRPIGPLTAPDDRKMVFGADASTSRDLTALVGVTYDQGAGFIDVVYCRTWKPQKIAGVRGGKPTVDLETTIIQEVLDQHKAGRVAAVIADPYQLHTAVLTWQRAGIRVVELAQNSGRVESDQALYDAIISRSIRHFNHPELNTAVRNAIAVETPRGFRLAKEKASKKIDPAVALSMAAWGGKKFRTVPRKAVSINRFGQRSDDPLYGVNVIKMTNLWNGK